MRSRARGFALMAGLVLAVVVFRAEAQVNFPDMILYNGKIITVDNHDFTSNLGTIAQAMHVKDGKVLHVGSNDQIRAMSGSGTKQIDLKGKTVIPGMILTHEHPFDWNPVEPYPVKKVLGNDDKVVVRFLEGSPDQNLSAFPRTLSEAVAKAQPGQWIYIIFSFGKNYEWATGGNGGMGLAQFKPETNYNLISSGKITKKMLDDAAPNNPVLVRDVFTGMMFNQKALDEAKRIFPYEGFITIKDEDGLGGANEMRWAFSDVTMDRHYAELVEIHRLGLEWWAGYGMTAYSSNAYNPRNHLVYHDLDQRGQMAIREGWSWYWRMNYFVPDRYWLADQAVRLNQGSDFYWNIGGRVATGSGCTTLQRIDGQAATGNCAYEPDSANTKTLYEFFKAGGRYAGVHHVGDRDVDNVMEIIERASKDAGMTDDQIRAKRHAFDHSVLFPRPDQVERFKKLGMIADGNAFEIFQAAPAAFQRYGERAVSWVVPKKRLMDNGIYNTIEMDRALGSTNFTIFHGLYWMISRKSWDGKVYAADQRVDRQQALKIATYQGAYYLLRENVLGSLEPGKWADFSVLDRDYLTIPEDDIQNIKVLMTATGGKIFHLVPSLAREMGVQPTGAQITLGGPAAQW